MSSSIYQSPLGNIMLEFNNDSLVALRFDDTDVAPDMAPEPPFVALDETRRWLDKYFSGYKPDFLPPIALVGTPFRRAVWQQLMNIPYGTTCTYYDIARRVRCRSARAVGQAIGSNPIAIIVPCHRVLGSNGRLTGYAYGLDRKRALLQVESRHNLA